MIEGLADLGMLEGLWRATPTRSLVCLRILNGRLFAPYSYDEGNSHLTGHYFSFRRVGDVVFARFEWFFAGDVAGFGVYKIVSPNKLAGGWWLDRDVPELSRDSELLITGTVRNMVPTTLLKEETTSVPLLLK